MEQLRSLLNLDEAILRAVERRRAPWITNLMATATRLGDPASWVAVSISLILSGDQARSLGSKVAVAALTATAMSQLVKRLVRRRRPTVTALLEHPDAFSFPSGHTAAASAVAVALAGQGELGAAAQIFAALTGMSRVYLGAHYPLDVLMGAILGALAGVSTRLLLGGA